MCCRSVLPYEGGCVGLGVVLVLSPSATVVVGVGSASVVGVGYSAGVGGGGFVEVGGVLGAVIAGCGDLWWCAVVAND